MNGNVELLVTPQELRNTANNFKTTNSRTKNITDQMIQKVQVLRQSFEGEAAEAYYRKLSALKVDMDKIYRKINEHVEDLNEIARNYDTAEATNKSTNASLKTNYI